MNARPVSASSDPSVRPDRSSIEQDPARPHTALIEPSTGTGEDLETEDGPSPEQAGQKHNIPLGISLMLCGIFLFVANDVMGKWLVATYSIGQVLLVRSAAGLLMLSPSLLKAGPSTLLNPPDRRMNIARVLLTTVEVVFFYWSAIYLPLADIVTYYMAAPIFVTLLAWPLLGERIDAPRLIAVIAGFIGVVIAMRPSSASFSWPALIAISGCILFSLIMIVTRHLRGTKGIVLVGWQSTGAFLFGVATASFGWVPPTPRDFLLLALLGIVATLAHVAVNRSLKAAPASVIMPYQYSQIIWAVILGYAIFGDWPDPMMLVGSALIIGAGLFIFWREQVVAARFKRSSGQPDP